jgi:hypothetical protein
MRIKSFLTIPAFILLFIVTSFTFEGCFKTSNIGSINKVPAVVESQAYRLTSELNKQGFEVIRGYFKQYTMGDCGDSFRVMGSCFLNNPASPYVLPVMPIWPEEFLDPATGNAFGATNSGYSVTYRFDPREAIVILGQLPPKAKYFGLQSYLITREGDYNKESAMYKKMEAIEPKMLETFFHQIPGNAKRIVTFDSLSDNINNVVIEQQSNASFDQLRYFVITPDQSMNQAIRDALGRIAVAEKDTFTEQIPSNKILGLQSKADEFMTLIRYAMPDGGEGIGSPAYTWRADLPLVVLRIRPIQQSWQPVPYKAFTKTDPEPRTAVDEHGLENDLNSLVSAVFDKWGQTYNAARVTAQVDFQSFFDLVGPKCDEIGMDCLGDNQDAAYQAHPLGFTLDHGEIYAYVGVLGTETGNASYVGLGVNNGHFKLGVYNISGDKLKGSADTFAGQVPNIGKFFVYYFTRDCAGLEGITGNYCHGIPKEDIPICADPTGVSCVRGVFTERDYMVPNTRRGPDSSHLLPGRYIKLQDPRL